MLAFFGFNPTAEYLSAAEDPHQIWKVKDATCRLARASRSLGRTYPTWDVQSYSSPILSVSHRDVDFMDRISGIGSRLGHAHRVRCSNLKLDFAQYASRNIEREELP
jgi:hypothetical protein